ncbi:MAG: cytochrome b, partial [Oceanobacter sp.]
MSNNQSYSIASKLFHWVSALIIIVLMVVGMMMEDMEGPEKYELMGMHKSFGVLIFLVLIARVINRFMDPVDEVPGISPLNAKLAKAGHGLLYLCMIIMPISGVLMS